MKNVVLLTTWGSPISTAYLKRLFCIDGIRLSVVYDRSEKLQSEIQRIYRERFGDRAPVFQPVDVIFEDIGIPNLSVSGLHSPESLKFIKGEKPYLLVLAGTGIIKKQILEIPVLGTLNCHPGILPRYRGCTCVEWAIYEDEPVGASCHFVTEEIDAGDILKKEVMPVYQDDSYLDIRLRMFTFQAELLSKTVEEIVQDEKPAISRMEKFDPEKAGYYSPIPEDKMKVVLEKIQKGLYEKALLPRRGF